MTSECIHESFRFLRGREIRKSVSDVRVGSADQREMQKVDIEILLKDLHEQLLLSVSVRDVADHDGGPVLLLKRVLRRELVELPPGFGGPGRGLVVGRGGRARVD